LISWSGLAVFLLLVSAEVFIDTFHVPYFLLGQALEWMMGLRYGLCFSLTLWLLGCQFFKQLSSLLK